MIVINVVCLGQVASKGPRFAVIDFRYIADERPQDKVVFFFWCPDSTGVRDKMMAASTYQSFRSAFFAFAVFFLKFFFLSLLLLIHKLHCPEF